jgi:hypothetical protein
MPAGYSGTPLAKKLGVRSGQRTWRSGMPASVAAEIASSGEEPVLLRQPETGLQMAHVFVTRIAELDERLQQIRSILAPDGTVWVSWPKKSARVATDITEDKIRSAALPLGFVDVKVCAIDEVWSGLKLVIRKSLRQP